MYLALKKCKKDCKIFKITLVQIFVHQNLKLLHLLSDFVLNRFRYAVKMFKYEKNLYRCLSHHAIRNIYLHLVIL